MYVFITIVTQKYFTCNVGAYEKVRVKEFHKTDIFAGIRPFLNMENYVIIGWKHWNYECIYVSYDMCQSDGFSDSASVVLFLWYYFEQVCKMYYNKFQVSLLDLMKMNQHHEMVAKERL